MRQKMQIMIIISELLKNKEICMAAISKLINTKKELDDFMDTLEWLSSQKIRE